MKPSVEDLRPKLRAAGFELPAGTVRVDGFGDSEESSRRLIGKVRDGTKRSGVSLAWSYECDGYSVPQAGDVEIVVDHRNEPVLVLRFTEVTVTPLDGLPPDFAAERRAFFDSECARIGRSPSETMPVVRVSFEVLFAMP